jgi:hypothetical protein
MVLHQNNTDWIFIDDQIYLANLESIGIMQIFVGLIPYQNGIVYYFLNNNK